MAALPAESQTEPAKEAKLKLVPKEPSWEELDDLSFDNLIELAERHKETLTSGQKADIERIAHLHARDLLPEAASTEADWPQVLQYIQQMLETGELDPLTVEEIHKTNGSAPGFQRLKADKATYKQYGDSGSLMESVRYYPSGTKVRTFHSVFKYAEQWEKATKGQEFFHALVASIKTRFDPASYLTDDEQYVADRIAKAAPIRPLNSANRVLDNIFVNGEDLQDYLRKQDPSVDERTRMLSEIADIDLITAFFSRKFKETAEGKTLYRKGALGRKKRFEGRDYRREVFEDIFLRVDKKFFRELADNGIISTAGVVMNEKEFNIFYDGDSDQAKALALIGISPDNIERQQFFTSYDLNLGNVMVADQAYQQAYTSIDFEFAQEDSLESLLFRRWAQSGIYDHKGSSKELEDGKTAEEHLLDSAYQTLDTLTRREGDTPITRDGFLEEFRMHKKKQLLRLARRYRSFEEKDADPEQMRAHSRYFYTLFVYELAKEGKIVGTDDEQLDYLNSLFEEPLTLEEMAEMAERYEPSFSSQGEVNPLNMKDVASQNLELIERYNSNRTWNRIKRIATWGTLALVLIGGAVAAKLGYDHLEEVDQQNAELQRDNSLNSRVLTLAKIDGASRDTNARLAQWRIEELERRYGDSTTARAFYLDPILTYEAMQETGSTDWETLTEYFYDAHDPENGRNFLGIVFALQYNDGYIDNFAYTDSESHRRIAREGIDEQEAEARAAYEARQAAESSKQRNCITLPAIGTIDGEGNVGRCVPNPMIAR